MAQQEPDGCPARTQRTIEESVFRDYLATHGYP
jgi:hypothetical protein